MEVLEDKILTARNKHICEVCKEMINRGTSYHDYYLQDEGEPFHFRVHIDCESDDFDVRHFIGEHGCARKVLGLDSGGQEIIPVNKDVTLRVFKNCHPNTDGTDWGWIEGCTLNICWSDNSEFTRDKARELVNDWNRSMT